jgi:hypothetical protein
MQEHMKRPLPLAALNTGFGWTERDAYYSYVVSRNQREMHSTAGPEVAPGEVYQVHYDKPFSWTRHTRTNYMYGPDGTSAGCLMQKQLKYSWKGVKDQETQFHTAPNYMFVLGTVNYTQSRQFLVLFYKPCANVNLHCDAGASSPPQGIWLPAIYSPDSGTLFSEVGQTQVHGRRNVLGWTSRSSVHTVLDTTADCGVDLEMSYAEVTAKRVTDTALLLNIRTNVLAPMFLYLLQSDASIATFANLYPTLESLPSSAALTAFQTTIYTHRACNFGSELTTDPKPEKYRFSPSTGYNGEHNRLPDVACPAGSAACPAASVSCSCDF